ncbi:MAG: hypothetical protein VSS52_013135 [Thiotrichaceae bacterium]|nr:hypothetical protein [Thiotrichaceae bacterium]
MFQAIEAEVDTQGNVKLLESIQLKESKKALVVILSSLEDINTTALLSESVLAQDWNREEEDEAWAKFQ